ncbi:CLD10 protein, partial [Atractosteus spatula]|nr:CLD10 protein [Atractosteus spatula]
MNYRELIMYTEIGCFVMCVSGWILVCSTMPTEYWNYSSIDGIVLTTANYFSNLWKSCISDSTGVSDCKEFPSLLALPAFTVASKLSPCMIGLHLPCDGLAPRPGCTLPCAHCLPVYIHACRALIITGIILGFFGGVLALIGMKCTKIGGSEIANARVTFAAGANYLIAACVWKLSAKLFFLTGLTSMIAFSWYGNKIRAEFVDPNFKAQKYEIGAAVFVGWGGSTLLIVGGLVYCIFAGRDGLRSR